MKNTNLFCAIRKVIQIITGKGVPAIIKDPLDTPLAKSEIPQERKKLQ
jgi:DNA-binding HxlR family transcriptional regulator